jgi:hypothetical protein
VLAVKITPGKLANVPAVFWVTPGGFGSAGGRPLPPARLSPANTKVPAVSLFSVPAVSLFLVVCCENHRAVCLVFVKKFNCGCFFVCLATIVVFVFCNFHITLYQEIYDKK